MSVNWPDDCLVAGYARGNPIVTYDGHTWVYVDGSPFDESRPCTKCAAAIPSVDLPDPCLGWLPGVANACCGHGVPGQEYVQTDDGERYDSIAEWRAAVLRVGERP